MPSLDYRAPILVVRRAGASSMSISARTMRLIDIRPTLEGTTTNATSRATDFPTSANSALMSCTMRALKVAPPWLRTWQRVKQLWRHAMWHARRTTNVASSGVRSVRASAHGRAAHSLTRRDSFAITRSVACPCRRCDDDNSRCRANARETDRVHLGIRAMVDDHHHCKAICEVSMSGGLRL